MRIVLPLAALLFTSAATAADAPSARSSAPAQRSAPQFDQGVISPDEARSCRDRIHTAREERGLPKLQRDTASPDEPLFIAAVDKRIDGCSVLVMRNNTSDIRPLPTIEGKGQLMPAR